MAALVAAAAMLAGLFGLSSGTASAVTYPVESTFSVAGPYATTTGTATDSAGRTYKLFYPANYAALGFQSPIVTWGNGTNGTPDMYSTLLNRFASYGITVIASTLANTGSGNEIDAGAHYLITQNSTAGSIFNGKLDVAHVAAVGHSQGAGGATRAATSDPSTIKTLMTFSLPNTSWVGSNANCPTVADCMFNTAALTVPAFFISTRGFLDSIIASPATTTGYYNSVTGHAALGLIKKSDGKTADHNSIQNTANGGNPGGELGYATAWLLYQLRGNATAAPAFSGSSPEIATNTNWTGSAAK